MSEAPGLPETFVPSRPLRGDWDVVIVGAGPAGSAAALWLTRAGHRVVVIERSRFPRHKACSEYLSPATTRLLERLGAGILERVEHAAHARLFGMKVVSPSGRAVIGRFAAAHDHPPPRPYSFAISRSVFDTILRDAAVASGAEVWEGVSVEDLLSTKGIVGGVTCRETGNGKRFLVPARIVIGADGLRSVVARRLGVRRHSRPSRMAFAAHFTDVRDVGDVGEMHVGSNGRYVGLGPIGDSTTTVALVVPRRHAQSFTPHEFSAALDRFPALTGRFAHARMVRPVLATGPFSQRSARVTGDGVCLVGDAADFFDPFTGQGIYNALRTAELAAPAVTTALADRGPVRRAALDPYVRARRAEFAGKWVLERLIGFGVGWGALTERVVARLAERPDLADLLVGATGNFVPARRVLDPRFLHSIVW